MSSKGYHWTRALLNKSRQQNTSPIDYTKIVGDLGNKKNRTNYSLVTYITEFKTK